ncbi:hypothetical protein ACO0RG_004281 [Hanseniaspora osmophila]|uniref:Regulator of phospholipase D SRF1 n=1 Tax=Hanseniaspora osmophila TaxID=56408 RepID=A0A1E5RAQ3_9ASCO|nr:Regulator of phospholipase D SRF1 [Hanseniaspora osmophila]
MAPNKNLEALESRDESENSSISQSHESTEVPTSNTKSSNTSGSDTKNKVDSENVSNTNNNHASTPALNSEVWLNSYSLNATTIPPFAVTAELTRERQESEHDPVAESQYLDQSREKAVITHTGGALNYSTAKDSLANTSTDPFLNSQNSVWGSFMTNVGSHTSYARNQTRALPLERKPNQVPEFEEKYTTPPESADESSFVNDLDSGSFRLNQFSKDEAGSTLDAQSIFADLNGSWGGQERLEAVLIAPGLKDQKFKNSKDKQEFQKNLKELRKVYYSSEKKTVGVKQANNKEKVATYFKQQYGVKKRRLIPQIKRTLFDNRYLPLFFRVSTIALCIIALGLASRIFINCKGNYPETDITIHQQPSTIMALVVNSIAIVYVVYIATDEFKGEPLGLRDPNGKLKIILLDLLFLLFCSANLALAFNSMYDAQWACHAGTDLTNRSPKLNYVCRKQKTLSAFLFIILCVWVLTFIIGIVRVVNKVGKFSQRGRVANSA